LFRQEAWKGGIEMNLGWEREDFGENKSYVKERRTEREVVEQG
jgi:hypothetical protein